MAIPTSFAEGAPKNRGQIQPFEAHPRIAARGVQIHVGTEVRQHQGFAKIAGAEVRNHKRQTGKRQRDRMKIDWVRVAHIERGVKPQFLAEPDAQHPAMHVDDSTGVAPLGPSERH